MQSKNQGRMKRDRIYIVVRLVNNRICGLSAAFLDRKRAIEFVESLKSQALADVGVTFEIDALLICQ